MEVNGLEQRKSELAKRRTQQLMPLWAQSFSPSETLRLLSDEKAPWGGLLRADAYLRNEMPVQAQRELDATPVDPSQGLQRMREALENNIKLKLSGCQEGDSDKSSSSGEAPLQQWLSRVRAFRSHN